VQLGQQDQLIN